VGKSAQALGVKMKRSSREEITKATMNGNGFVQDKEGGITAIYGKDYKLQGIMKKDGTTVNANSLSAEERAKYDLDVDKGFGVIDTKTGNFIRARKDAPVETGNSIGKVNNKDLLNRLNKIL